MLALTIAGAKTRNRKIYDIMLTIEYVAKISNEPEYVCYKSTLCIYE